MIAPLLVGPCGSSCQLIDRPPVFCRQIDYQDIRVVEVEVRPQWRDMPFADQMPFLQSILCAAKVGRGYPI